MEQNGLLGECPDVTILDACETVLREASRPMSAEEIHAEISRIDKLYDEDISEIEGDDSLNDEKKSQKIQAMHQEMSEACIGLGVLTREFIEYKTKK
jgi:hypothetical protein